ncbi:MAG: (deoxy)nucleoside triphosphate pyrophosphohydrolase [Micavibrio aeruginosavorus]|nr:(deoxy)nucleoside triphosphate pyrophosphohydrolase [Micavibrio aeruginosavorus]
MACRESLAQPKPVQKPLPTLFVVAAALIDAEGRVLLAQRPEGKAMAGLWEFPGGKVHEGEIPEFALMRELEEELGIETRPTCYLPIGFASHSYDDFHLMMPLFACRMWKGDISPREGQAVQWLHPRAMYGLPMPEADRPLIHQLEAQI